MLEVMMTGLDSTGVDSLPYMPILPLHCVGLNSPQMGHTVFGPPCGNEAIQMQCNDTIRVRVPEHLAGAVKSAAAAKYLSASAYIRQAVADRLERDGFSTQAFRCIEIETKFQKGKPGNLG